jgi:rhamnosyltransferase
MKVSIVIPTLNAGLGFDGLLTIIASQAIGEPFEVVVVDSESSDGTPELAERRGARVHRIRRADFNHGETRNLGVEVATGEFVAFLSQDAMPRDDGWLQELLEPFSDPRVAGVYSRVVPRSDATPLVARSVEADLVAGVAPLYKTIANPESWSRLPATTRRREGHFNNVASCVRRSAVQQFGFPALSFGEDLAWGLRVLETGGALVYQPKAVVEHSHASSLSAEFQRHMRDARLLRTLFDYAPGPMEASRTLAAEVFRDLAVVKDCSRAERVRYGLYSPWLRSAQALGRLVGAHLASTTRDRAVLDAW